MRGHLEKRTKDTWRIRIEVGKGPDGTRQRASYAFQGNKRAAEAELSRLLGELSTGAFVQPSRMTVGPYLEWWLENVAKDRVAPRTYERYIQIVRLHLIPALGQHRLQQLHPLHIEACYRSALTGGRARRDKHSGKLSAASVLQHHRVLHKALGDAVRRKMLPVNPCDAVTPPRVSQPEMRALDEDETARVLDAARGGDWYTPIVLAVTTGLRRGELLGLKWSHIDLEAGTLTVARSLQQTRDGLQFKEPKTAKSTRTISLPQLAVEALTAHKAEQARLRLAMGPAYHDQGLVFAKPDGGPMRPDALSQAFRALVKRLGLGVRLHGLRHSHASQLLRAGVPVKVVSERLGHSTAMLTLNTYAHVLPGQQEEAAAMIDSALRAALARTGDAVG